MSETFTEQGGFQESNGEFFCESVPLHELARRFGTPLYVYSKSKLRANCLEFKTAFDSYPTEFFYAVKANDNLHLLREIFKLGFGADVVSIGEIERARKVGLDPKKIVFSGVGKTTKELDRAIELGLGTINVESAGELESIVTIAHRKQVKVSVNLRVNPNIPVETNPYIATGLYQTKFGIADESVFEVVRTLKNNRWVSLDGIACHIGSQILEVESFRRACSRMRQLGDELKKDGFPIARIDMGGGLGISYQSKDPAPTMYHYGEALIEPLRNSQFKLFLEPGRSIVGNTGVLLTEVVYTKQNRERHFTIVDTAMNDLIRPCLYEAHHDICHVRSKNSERVLTDIVGPVCETGDFLGLNRSLESPTQGDLLFIKDIGAYGATMSSNYNSRPRAASVLVSGAKAELIRGRESLDSLWALEILT